MFYREHLRDDLVQFEVLMKETDLLIKADKNLYREAMQLVAKYRAEIEEYGVTRPEFFGTFEPCNVEFDAPSIVRDMAKFSSLCGVGPMSGIAGAIAEYVGRDLLQFTSEIIVENGGDIYLKSGKLRIISIFAGESVFSKKIGIKVQPWDTPIGIRTSSGTVGHSLSFGNDDAVVAVSESSILADASATAIGNLIKGDDGVVIIKGDKLGILGKVIIEPIR